MTTTEVVPSALVRPWWGRARFWLALAAVAVVGAALVGTLGNGPGRPLDPASAHKNGSKALVRLLTRYGATVTTTTSWTTAISRADHEGAADGVIVVTAPDDYSGAALAALSHSASVARLVLVQPGERALAAAAPGVELAGGGFSSLPACADRGASAAGAVAFPSGTRAYSPGTSATACFGGAFVTETRLGILGSGDLLRNDHLAAPGVAALDLNAITDSGRISNVVWLSPGADATGAGAVSIWDLFPAGAYRAFWWTLVLGALVALWRGRRLGGTVAEPLPVIVRSVEVVEGQGRLYARAGARDRAAAALRNGATARLGARLGLPRGTPAEPVAVAAAALVGRPAADVVAVLAGPVPADDAGLHRLAQDLDTVESAVIGGSAGGTTPQ